MEKVLYVDLDGTLLDTEDYLHKIFTANGVKYSKNCLLYTSDAADE
mgnify:CR=1 FL=1